MQGWVAKNRTTLSCGQNSTAQANALYKQGLEKIQQEEYAEAIKYLTEAIRLQADFTNAFYQRGIAYFKLSNSDNIDGDNYSLYRENSFKDFSKAIKLKPDFLEAYYYRGFIRGISNDNDDFDKIISINPNQAEAYFYRAFTRLKTAVREKIMGSESVKKQNLSAIVDKSVKDLTVAIKLNHNFAEAYYLRQFIILAFKVNNDDKSTQQAYKDYLKAVQINPYFFILLTMK